MFLLFIEQDAYLGVFFFISFHINFNSEPMNQSFMETVCAVDGMFCIENLFLRNEKRRSSIIFAFERLHHSTKSNSFTSYLDPFGVAFQRTYLAIFSLHLILKSSRSILNQIWYWKFVDISPGNFFLFLILCFWIQLLHRMSNSFVNSMQLSNTEPFLINSESININSLLFFICCTPFIFNPSLCPSLHLSNSITVTWYFP